MDDAGPTTRSRLRQQMRRNVPKTMVGNVSPVTGLTLNFLGLSTHSPTGSQPASPDVGSLDHHLTTESMEILPSEESADPSQGSEVCDQGVSIEMNHGTSEAGSSVNPEGNHHLQPRRSSRSLRTSLFRTTSTAPGSSVQGASSGIPEQSEGHRSQRRHTLEPRTVSRPVHKRPRDSTLNFSPPTPEGVIMSPAAKRLKIPSRGSPVNRRYSAPPVSPLARAEGLHLTTTSTRRTSLGLSRNTSAPTSSPDPTIQKIPTDDMTMHDRKTQERPATRSRRSQEAGTTNATIATRASSSSARELRRASLPAFRPTSIDNFSTPVSNRSSRSLFQRKASTSSCAIVTASTITESSNSTPTRAPKKQRHLRSRSERHLLLSLDTLDRKPGTKTIKSLSKLNAAVSNLAKALSEKHSSEDMSLGSNEQVATLLEPNTVDSENSSDSLDNSLEGIAQLLEKDGSYTESCSPTTDSLGTKETSLEGSLTRRFAASRLTSPQETDGTDTPRGLGPSGSGGSGDGTVVTTPRPSHTMTRRLKGDDALFKSPLSPDASPVLTRKRHRVSSGARPVLNLPRPQFAPSPSGKRVIPGLPSPHLPPTPTRNLIHTRSRSKPTHPPTLGSQPLNPRSRSSTPETTQSSFISSPRDVTEERNPMGMSPIPFGLASPDLDTAEVSESSLSDLVSKPLITSRRTLFSGVVGGSTPGAMNSSFPSEERHKETVETPQMNADAETRLVPSRVELTPGMVYSAGVMGADAATHSETPQCQWRRHHSDSEMVIKSAVRRAETNQDLIGDYSRPHSLLTVPGGKHQDLKYISPETLAEVVKKSSSGRTRVEQNVTKDSTNNDYNSVNPKNSEYMIIDCRYPYEYEGGHIHNAINLYTKEQIIEFLNQHHKRMTERTVCSSMNNSNTMGRSMEQVVDMDNGIHMDNSVNIENGVDMDMSCTDSSDQGTTAASSNPTEPGPSALIFHCEFSSERGPKLARFLRGQDRDLNRDAYPLLTFPEIYVAEGGYRVFYQQHPDLCTPNGYTPMLHENFAHDLRKFKLKSRSWTAGEKGTPSHHPGGGGVGGGRRVPLLNRLTPNVTPRPCRRKCDF